MNLSNFFWAFNRKARGLLKWLFELLFIIIGFILLILIAYGFFYGLWWVCVKVGISDFFNFSALKGG